MATVDFRPTRKFGTFKWGQQDTGIPQVARLLYHGGLIDPGSIEALTRQKAMRVKSLGFMRELDFYRAWQYSKEQGDLSIIQGIQVWSYGVGQRSTPSYGPKLIKLSQQKSNFGQIEILDVSSDYTPGVYPFKFRYPVDFSWDRKAWASHFGLVGLDGDGAKILQGINGSATTNFIRIKLADSGNNRPFVFPGEDVQSLIKITRNGPAIDSKISDLTLTFDGGPPVPLKPWFDDIYSFDASVGTFSADTDNVTGKLMINHQDTVTLMADVSDSIYIGSSNPFYGIEFLFDSSFAATKVLEIRYSNWPNVDYQGGLNGLSSDFWGDTGFTDETSGFSQDGSVYWSESNVGEWTKSSLALSATEKHDYYWIRIKVTSVAPGTCTAYTIRRHLRLPGSKGDYLTVKINPEALQFEDLEEEIIVRPDSNGDAVPATWYRSSSIHNAITQIANIANYRGEILEQDEVRLVSNSYHLNVFANIPAPNYYQPVSCVYVDSADSDRVYIGVGKELWSFKQKGELEKLGTIETIDASDPDNSFNQIEIKRLTKDGNNIVGVAWVPLDANWPERIDSPSAEFSFNTLTDAFSYTDAGGTVTHEHLYRDGKNYLASGQYHQEIGQEVDEVNHIHAGENIVIPFEQIISARVCEFHGVTDGLNVGLVDADSFLGDTDRGYPAWYFDDDPVGDDDEGSQDQGPFFVARPGNYKTRDFYGTAVNTNKVRLGLKHKWGQKGFVEFYEPDSKWYALETRSDDTRERINPAPIDGAASDFEDCLFFFNTTKTDTIDSSVNILCAEFTSDSLAEIVVSFIQWWDEGVWEGNLVSYSYLGKFKQNGNVQDWSKAFHYNFTGTAYTDATTDLNNGTGAYTLDEGSDIIYVGDDNTFLSVYFDVTNSAFDANVVVDYWDGVAWTEMNADAINDNTTDLTADGHWTWRPPRDWATTTVNGTSAYWVRFRVKTYIGGSTVIVAAQNAWTIWWDSRIESTDRGAQAITDFVYNSSENTIHGCIYDRNDGLWVSANDPHKFIYYVYDIANDTHTYDQTGDNFTFEIGRPIRHFVYNGTDNCVYSIATSLKDRERGCWLFKASFTAPSTINLSRVGILPGGAYDSKTPLSIDSNGGVIGACGPTIEVIWQYSDTLYPRVPLLSLGTMTVTEALATLAQLVNSVLQVTSERIMRIQNRAGLTTPGTFTAGRRQIINIKPARRFKHIYRGIVVNWSGESGSGNESFGDIGDDRQILSVSNPFIQDPYFALTLSRIYFDYFKSIRYIFEADLTYLLQLELGDEVTFDIAARIVGIDTTKEWILWDCDLDTESRKLIGKFLEKVS